MTGNVWVGCEPRHPSLHDQTPKSSLDQNKQAVRGCTCQANLCSPKKLTHSTIPRVEKGKKLCCLGGGGRQFTGSGNQPSFGA